MRIESEPSCKEWLWQSRNISHSILGHLMIPHPPLTVEITIKTIILATDNPLESGDIESLVDIERSAVAAEIEASGIPLLLKQRSRGIYLIGIIRGGHQNHVAEGGYSGEEICDPFNRTDTGGESVRKDNGFRSDRIEERH